MLDRLVGAETNKHTNKSGTSCVPFLCETARFLAALRFTVAQEDWEGALNLMHRAPPQLCPALTLQGSHETKAEVNAPALLQLPVATAVELLFLRRVCENRRALFCLRESIDSVLTAPLPPLACMAPGAAAEQVERLRCQENKFKKAMEASAGVQCLSSRVAQLVESGKFLLQCRRALLVVDASDPVCSRSLSRALEQAPPSLSPLVVTEVGVLQEMLVLRCSLHTLITAMAEGGGMGEPGALDLRSISTRALDWALAQGRAVPSVSKDSIMSVLLSCGELVVAVRRSLQRADWPSVEGLLRSVNISIDGNSISASGDISSDPIEAGKGWSTAIIAVAKLPYHACISTELDRARVEVAHRQVQPSQYCLV